MFSPLSPPNGLLNDVHYALTPDRTKASGIEIARHKSVRIIQPILIETFVVETGGRQGEEAEGDRQRGQFHVHL